MTQRYIVYLTVATSTQPAGHVVDAIMWDGQSLLSLPATTATLADPNGQYPIGSVYVPVS